MVYLLIKSLRFRDHSGPCMALDGVCMYASSCVPVHVQSSYEFEGMRLTSYPLFLCSLRQYSIDKGSEDD